MLSNHTYFEVIIWLHSNWKKGVTDRLQCSSRELPVARSILPRMRWMSHCDNLCATLCDFNRFTTCWAICWSICQIIVSLSLTFHVYNVQMSVCCFQFSSHFHTCSGFSFYILYSWYITYRSLESFNHVFINRIFIGMDLLLLLCGPLLVGKMTKRFTVTVFTFLSVHFSTSVIANRGRCFLCELWSAWIPAPAVMQRSGKPTAQKISLIVPSRQKQLSDRKC